MQPSAQWTADPINRPATGRMILLHVIGQIVPRVNPPLGPPPAALYNRPMSTFGTPPQPPESSEWDSLPPAVGNSPVGLGRSGPATRAAVLLWIVGGMQVALGGCCGGMVLLVQFMPVDIIEKAVRDGSIRADQLEQFLAVKEQAWIGATILLTLGLLPGLLHLALAFGVRAGKAVPMVMAMAILLLQSLALGAWTTMTVSVMLSQGLLRDGLMNLMVAVPLLLLMVYTFAQLRLAWQHARHAPQPGGDPWQR